MKTTIRCMPIGSLALAWCVLAACGDPPRGESVWTGETATSPTDGDASDVGESGGAGNETSNADATGGDSDGGPDSGMPPGPLLDVGSNDSGPPPVACDPDDEECGCTAVDILFVIDNSGSMYAHQQALANAFPSFVDVIFESLPTGTDLHVGITTQGGFWSGSGAGNWNGQCVSDAQPYPDGFTPPSKAVQGTNGDQGRLYEHEGLRYFETNTADDPSALSAWFSTAATLPGAISEQQDQVELMSAAAAYAFHPANADHNDGFLRDEGAVLLIFFLTDTADVTPESADSLADIVRAAKSGCGGDDCIVTAGMVPENHFCGAEYPRLGEFLEAFGKPPAAVGDLDAFGGGWPPQSPPPEAFQAVLGDALGSIIAQTCAEIPPPAG